jgi:hypothetical protein
MGVLDGSCRFSFLIFIIVCVWGSLSGPTRGSLVLQVRDNEVLSGHSPGILHFRLKCGPDGPSLSVLEEVKCLQQRLLQAETCFAGTISRSWVEADTLPHWAIVLSLGMLALLCGCTWLPQRLARLKIAFLCLCLTVMNYMSRLPCYQYQLFELVEL